MDILAIYWNSVWAHGASTRSGMFEKHSAAEEWAFARALNTPPNLPPRLDPDLPTVK